MLGAFVAPILLPVLLLVGEVGRVRRGDVGFANVFLANILLAVGLGKAGVWKTGARLEEGGSPRPTGGVDAGHRGPTWGRAVRGRGGDGGMNRGFGLVILG